MCCQQRMDERMEIVLGASRKFSSAPVLGCSKWDMILMGQVGPCEGRITLSLQHGVGQEGLCSLSFGVVM